MAPLKNRKKSCYENIIILLMGFAGAGKLSIAKELAKKPNFRLVDNHTWINPVFNLIDQNEKEVDPDAVWQKTDEVRSVLFNTISNLSPSYYSFVITQEMIAGDEYPKRFYSHVCKLIQDRRSIFLPVRFQKKVIGTWVNFLLLLSSKTLVLARKQHVKSGRSTQVSGKFL